MKPSSVWIARALLGVGTALWLHLAPARAESPAPPAPALQARPAGAATG